MTGCKIDLITCSCRILSLAIGNVRSLEGNLSYYDTPVQRIHKRMEKNKTMPFSQFCSSDLRAHRAEKAQMSKSNAVLKIRYSLSVLWLLNFAAPHGSGIVAVGLVLYLG